MIHYLAELSLSSLVSASSGLPRQYFLSGIPAVLARNPVGPRDPRLTVKLVELPPHSFASHRSLYCFSKRYRLSNAAHLRFDERWLPPFISAAKTAEAHATVFIRRSSRVVIISIVLLLFGEFWQEKGKANVDSGGTDEFMAEEFARAGTCSNLLGRLVREEGNVEYFTGYFPYKWLRNERWRR